MKKLTLSFLLIFSLSAYAQWSPVSSGTTNNLNAVHLLDSGVAYAVGDAGTILKSSDAGASWVTLSSGTSKSLHGIYVFDDETAVAVGDQGTILRTTDGGDSWSTVPSGVKDTLLSVSFSGANGISAGNSQEIVFSSDSGASWQVSQKNFFGGGFPGAQMLTSTLGLVAGQNSIFQPLLGVTNDGGASWNFTPFYFNDNEGGANDLYFFDSQTGVVSGILFDGTGALARTTDGGATWTTNLYPNAMHGIDFSVSASGFVVGAGGSILHSADMGVSWSAQESGTGVELFDVDFESNAQTGIAVGASGTILRTNDGGETKPLTLVAAASQRGNYRIPLPLTGPSGVECRIGASSSYRIIMQFSTPLSSVGSVSSTCGTVHRVTIDPNDNKRLMVSLDDVSCYNQNITVTANDLEDTNGGTLSSASVTVGLLIGDVNGDRVVDRRDIRLTRRARGEPTTQQNFRADINVDGRITQRDLLLTRANLGATLPPNE